MIKLDKQQLTALANKIASEVNEIRDKTNDSLKKKAEEEFYSSKDYKNIEKYNKLVSELNEFRKTLPVKKNGYGYTSPEHMGSHVYPIVMEGYNISVFLNYKPIPLLSPDKVKDDIVLETIGSDDLDSIINKIKAKYA